MLVSNGNAKLSIIKYREYNNKAKENIINMINLSKKILLKVRYKSDLFFVLQKMDAN